MRIRTWWILKFILLILVEHIGKWKIFHKKLFTQMIIYFLLLPVLIVRHQFSQCKLYLFFKLGCFSIKYQKMGISQPRVGRKYEGKVFIVGKCFEQTVSEGTYTKSWTLTTLLLSERQFNERQIEILRLTHVTATLPIP